MPLANHKNSALVAIATTGFDQKINGLRVFPAKYRDGGRDVAQEITQGFSNG
jgi:hypothetical protein